MIWTTVNIIFLAMGIILIIASNHFNKCKYDDILEALMCIVGIIFIIVFAVSEGIRWLI